MVVGNLCLACSYCATSKSVHLPAIRASAAELVLKVDPAKKPKQISIGPSPRIAWPYKDQLTVFSMTSARAISYR